MRHRVGDKISLGQLKEKVTIAKAVEKNMANCEDQDVGPIKRASSPVPDTAQKGTSAVGPFTSSVSAGSPLCSPSTEMSSSDTTSDESSAAEMDEVTTAVVESSGAGISDDGFTSVERTANSPGTPILEQRCRVIDASPWINSVNTNSTYSYDFGDSANVIVKTEHSWAHNLDVLLSTLTALDLVTIYLIFHAVDRFLVPPTRLAYLTFSLYSIKPFHRAWILSRKLFASLFLVILLLNMLIYAAFRCRTTVLYKLADALVYGNIIGYSRGFNSCLPWGMYGVILGLEWAWVGRMRPWDFAVGVHCVGIGIWWAIKEGIMRGVEYRCARRLTSAVEGELRLWNGVRKRVGRRRGIWRRKRTTSATPLQPRSGNPQPAQERQLYYSNHYDLHSRFELTLLSVTHESVHIAWTFPQSLIVTLCSIPPSAIVTAAHSHIRPPPFISGSLPNPPQKGTITLSPNDIDVLVDLTYWPREKLDVNICDRWVKVRGLAPGRVYTISLAVRGFWSVPVRVELPRKVQATRNVDVGESDTPLDSPSSPMEESLVKKKETLDDLLVRLDEQRAAKKNSQASFKKLAKDLGKSGESLKADLEAFRRSLLRDLQVEARFRQRIRELEEAVNGLRDAIRSVEANIERTVEEREQILLEVRNVEGILDDVKKRVKAQNELHKKEINEWDQNLDRCREAIGSLQAELDALTKNWGDLDKDVKAATQGLYQLNQKIAEARHWRDTYVQEESGAQALKAAVEIARKRNERLKKVLEGERGFRGVLEAGVSESMDRDCYRQVHEPIEDGYEDNCEDEEFEGVGDGVLRGLGLGGA